MTRRSRILAAAVLSLSLAQPLAVRAADPVAGSGALPALSPPTQPIAPAAAAPAAPTPVAPTPVAAENAKPAEAPTPAAPAAPAALPGNREAATAVADALRQAAKAGQLRHYNIDVTVKYGATELSGTVANAQQREEAMNVARGVARVGRVVDKLTLLAPSAITQVQATGAAAPALQPAPAPLPGAQVPAPPPAIREPFVGPAPAPQVGVIPEPLPTFAAPMPSPYDLNPPHMPPYAWPTYAPYNNFSRVAYPTCYPYESWPFIGPCYPFPKIPPGWRSVKLEWEDGHWWYCRVATGESYWRIRFW
jgi:hypothetical protein